MSDEGQQVCYMNSTFFDLVVLSLFRISLAFYPYFTTVCSYLLCSEYTDLAHAEQHEGKSFQLHKSKSLCYKSIQKPCNSSLSGSFQRMNLYQYSFVLQQTFYYKVSLVFLKIRSELTQEWEVCWSPGHSINTQLYVVSARSFWSERVWSGHRDYWIWSRCFVCLNSGTMIQYCYSVIFCVRNPCNLG